jgi:hypothetical protein
VCVTPTRTRSPDVKGIAASMVGLHEQYVAMHDAIEVVKARERDRLAREGYVAEGASGVDLISDGISKMLGYSTPDRTKYVAVPISAVPHQSIPLGPQQASSMAVSSMASSSEIPVFDPISLLKVRGCVPLRESKWREKAQHLTIIGKTDSGKTYLVKYLLSKTRDIWGDGSVFWVCPRYSWDSNKVRSSLANVNPPPFTTLTPRSFSTFIYLFLPLSRRRTFCQTRSTTSVSLSWTR